MVSAAVRQVIFIAVAFNHTSCSFNIRSISEAVHTGLEPLLSLASTTRSSKADR